MRRLSFRAIPALLIVVSLTLVLWRRAETVPLYAARTGLQCQSCHFDPNGGGPRNEFGFSYARNRHSLEAEDSTSKWHDLSIGNRVGESLPLYVGFNQRFMLLATKRTDQDSLERLGFFNMENSFYFTFQPHPQLSLVYRLESTVFSGNRVANQDAFGIFSGLPQNGYVKVGRFRTPFGLRMDDHTVATRNAFLDFYTMQSFLPYDPRRPDEGVEIGMERNGIFGRAAYTNGQADVFGGQFAGAKTVKIGYNRPEYQGAISFYDDYRKETGSGIKRATRWGYYGMTRYRTLALLGEIAGGTDEAEPDPFSGLASGPKNNVAALFAELDYAPIRSVNLRLRFDHLELSRNRSEIPGSLTPGLTYRDWATHDRYSVEGEFVPVPFAELRWTFRRIDHRADKDPFGFDIPDENQAYVQLHLSY